MGTAFVACNSHVTLRAQASGERLMDVLAASKRRCTLVDRGDMLSRHLTGATRSCRAPPVLGLHSSRGCVLLTCSCLRRQFQPCGSRLHDLGRLRASVVFSLL